MKLKSFFNNKILPILQIPFDSLKTETSLITSFTFLNLIVFKIVKIVDINIHFLVIIIFNLCFVYFFKEFLSKVAIQISNMPIFVKSLYYFLEFKNQIYSFCFEYISVHLLSFAFLGHSIFIFSLVYLFGIFVFNYLNENLFIVFVLLLALLSIFNKIECLIFENLKKEPFLLANNENKFNFTVVKQALHLKSNIKGDLNKKEFTFVQKRHMFSSLGSRILAEPLKTAAGVATTATAAFVSYEYGQKDNQIRQQDANTNADKVNLERFQEYRKVNSELEAFQRTATKGNNMNAAEIANRKYQLGYLEKSLGLPPRPDAPSIYEKSISSFFDFF